MSRIVFGALVAWYAAQLVFGGVLSCARARARRRARELRERNPDLH